MGFLPINRDEMINSGIEKPDFVFVSGDAYCDHPSFGTAIIARMLNRHGYSVCILSQPDFINPEAFLEFGIPRLGWLVSSGNIDSMVNHYSVSKRRRQTDSYTPGGKIGKRPDRAVIKYANIIRLIDESATIILGGIEASLRRFAHYDYWSNKVMKSVLLDSLADIIVYGMGEKAIVEIADSLDSGLDVSDLVFIRGTVFRTKSFETLPQSAIMLPSYKEINSSKQAYAKSFMIQSENTDYINANILVENYDDIYVVGNPPQPPLSRFELDQVYELPFMREAHPLLEKQGHIGAMDEIKFSITANRGCYGGCSFCALTMHQGRIIQSRSKQSIISEAKKIVSDPEFKGYIHDVGGPTANFYEKACQKQDKYGVCQSRQCIGDIACPQLEISHENYLDILQSLRQIEGVKKVFIRSGIRYDYLMYDPDKTFFKELVQHHISGQLKVAPEHVSPNVLEKMSKPKQELFDAFVKEYNKLNDIYGKNQYLVPYFMSSHPGSTLKDAVMLAEYIRDMGYTPEQVQDFYPTPMTLATAMFYTELDPRTMEPLYVAKKSHDKAMQRALIQYKNPKNWALVKEALVKCDRQDLIGLKTECLIRQTPPRRGRFKY